MGRAVVLPTITVQIVDAQIIGEDEDDVGLVCGLECAAETAQEREGDY